MPQNIKGYEAILEEHQRAHWPESFLRDLYVIDFRILTKENAPQTFSWHLRENGTHLYPTDAPDFCTAIQAFEKNYPYPDGRSYLYNGSVLREITPRQLIEWKEEGSVMLPEKMGITSQECLDLRKKCRLLQREVREQIDEDADDERSNYLEGLRWAFGCCAMEIDDYENAFYSNEKRADRIKEIRLQALAKASRMNLHAIRLRDKGEENDRANALGKEQGYLEAAYHFSAVVEMPNAPVKERKMP